MVKCQSKRCPVCKKDKPLSSDYFHKDASETSGFHSTCKDCRNAIDAKSKREPSRRYGQAKAKAKKRKIQFLITKEQYCELIKNNCYYCDGFFKPVLTGIGLDRLDNKKGYVIDNVVSCCMTCNSIKNNFLSEDETLAAIAAIIRIRNAKSK